MYGNPIWTSIGAEKPNGWEAIYDTPTVQKELKKKEVLSYRMTMLTERYTPENLKTHWLRFKWG
jgi:hypothetical protein